MNAICPISDVQEPTHGKLSIPREDIYEHWIRVPMSKELNSLHKRIFTIAQRNKHPLKKLNLRFQFSDWKFEGWSTGILDLEDISRSFERTKKEFVGELFITGEYGGKKFNFSVVNLTGRLSSFNILFFDQNINGTTIMNQIRSQCVS